MDATDGFSEAKCLGEGGFGHVYLGTIKNGVQVAIKKLKSGSGQGEAEFQAEVDIISRVHHRNLVSLVGYCISKRQRILVYEFVSNQSLKFHLHGRGRPVMEWSKRVRVAVGAARALSYLHHDCHPKIIHHDIKPDNILLDDTFEVRIADFGLAKFFPDGKSYIDGTRLMGTVGYMDPECVATGRFTELSDVYSFGVVLLELISGREALGSADSPGSRRNLARPLMYGHKYEELADLMLSRYSAREMRRFVDCAAACVRRSREGRPAMSEVVQFLDGNLSLNQLNEGNAASGGSSTSGDTHFFSV
ncbi:proline-rich receptor-like protein kinase PERK3 isoform X2 [Tasmannia lanceolata]|uniref:proline-rich receptor-like protein kinase PERK3 isoform X2 n=1 Tax=Tasmannia lanceolata TaxID=3420 RepID=UPI0040636CED